MEWTNSNPPWVPYSSSSCMDELQSTLGTIFIYKLFVGSAVEIGIPLFKHLRAYYEQIRGVDQDEAMRHSSSLHNQNESNALLLSPGGGGGIGTGIGMAGGAAAQAELRKRAEKQRLLSDVESTFVQVAKGVVCGCVCIYIL